MRNAVLSCLFFAGCGGAAASGAAPPEPPASTPPDAVLVSVDGGAERGTCQLETSTTLRRRGDAYEITAQLRNPTNQTLVVEMPDRCPQGAAVFQGLPDGYDYYRSCTKGACMDGRPPIRHSIAAGETIDVEAIEIDPVHASCNRPLEPGRYTLTFTFETPLTLCTGASATFEHAVAAQPKSPEKPKAKCPPMPACGLACPGSTFATDANGCSQCACAKEPFGPRPLVAPAPSTL